MREHIRIDLALLEQIAVQLMKLSYETEQLEHELRRLRYGLPAQVEALVMLEMAREHGRMADATDRAERLSRRVRQGMELFDRCEAAILERAQMLETGINPDLYASKRQAEWNNWSESWG